MTRRSFELLRIGLALSVGVAPFVSMPLAEAQTSGSSVKLACVQASDKAQQLRVAGKLLEARDSLRACVLDACPGVVREACAQWLGEVQASLPSIVIGAKDGDGRDLLDVKVSIDGKLVTEHLGGLAVPIDPGRHKMRYEKADGTFLEEDILVGEGTKNRAVSVAFPAPKASAVGSTTPATAPTDGAKAATPLNTGLGVTFAAVGAGVLATALYLDLSATSDINALKAEPCAKTSTCPSSRVSSDQLDYDLAGVGLGLGIAAVGVAVYIFVAHPFGGHAASQQALLPGLRVVPSAHGSGLAFTF
jgi:hypothetical protein